MSQNEPIDGQRSSVLQTTSVTGSRAPQSTIHLWDSRIQSMHPARKPGPAIRKHLALAIPVVPSPPSNTAGYTPVTPRHSSATLLPSFSLPSPITPTSNTNINSVAESTSVSAFITAPDPVAHTRAQDIDPTQAQAPHTSLWAFDSSSPAYSSSNRDEWMQHVNTNFAHSRQPVHKLKVSMTESDRLERAMRVILDELEYSSVADFFSAYLQEIARGSADSRTPHHRQSLQKFLQGRTQVKPVDIIQQMYSHRYSYPSHKSQHLDQRKQAFSSDAVPASISYARCSISSWATQLVGSQARRDIKNLTHDDKSPAPDALHVSARLVASANERTRAKGVKMVTKEDMMSFRFADRARLFKTRAPLVWYLTECMAAPRKNGKIVVRKRRNPSLIQAAAISSFILSTNQRANGYMAMHMGVWHIACGSHVDVKRAASHLASSVHETTARNALTTMAETSLQNLRNEVGEGQDRGQVLYRFVLDNIQEFQRVWEGGIGLENRLICGCAGTAIALDDCAADAFSFEDRFARVLKNERSTLTAEKLFADIDWDHIRGTQTLHVLRALFSYTPALESMEKDVTHLFRTKYAIHRMREGRKTKVVPLGCNSEKEIETEGIKRAIFDFSEQAGVKPEYASSLISLIGGDGGTVLAIDRAMKQSATLYDPDDSESDYRNLNNVVPTLGLWHTQATAQNCIAGNHYGPAVTDDPSALSRSAACAGFKRPTNFKDCSNYYNLSRSMMAFWESQILDCWRLELDLNDYTKIVPHFENLAQNKRLPDFAWFLSSAQRIVDRYMTQNAYEQALSAKLNRLSPESTQLPIGDPYVPASVEKLPQTESNEKIPISHEEKKEFDGDRVLANSILFKMEYSWWIEAAYAIPEGDIGRVWEIMKIYIFLFAAGGHSNYVNLLVEMYCLFRFESSKDLKNAIWNNWLVNVTGELGKYIPDDLLQEHYNRWLEEMVRKSGGSFDDDFLRLKEELEAALELFKRSKSHTSRHLRAEYKQLLTMYGEENIHLFRTGRSQGHAAVNRFDYGFRHLDEGGLTLLLDKHTKRVDVLRKVNIERQAAQVHTTDTTGTESHPHSQSPSAALDHVSPSRSPSPMRIDSPVHLYSLPPTPTPSSGESSDDEHEAAEGMIATAEVEECVDERDEDSDDIELIEAEQLSRLDPGPELMPSIDSESGRLIHEWDESNLDEEMDTDAEDGDDDTDSGTDDGDDESLDSDIE